MNSFLLTFYAADFKTQKVVKHPISDIPHLRSMWDKDAFSFQYNLSIAEITDCEYDVLHKFL